MDVERDVEFGCRIRMSNGMSNVMSNLDVEFGCRIWMSNSDVEWDVERMSNGCRTDVDFPRSTKGRKGRRRKSTQIKAMSVWALFFSSHITISFADRHSPNRIKLFCEETYKTNFRIISTQSALKITSMDFRKC